MAHTATVVATPCIAYGVFSSAGTAVDEVVTVGFTPKFVLCVIDVNATAPEIVIGYNDSTVTDFADVVNHASTQILSPVLASGIHTYTTNGFTIDATKQNDDGENFYICVG